MQDFFISHSGKDRGWAEWIAWQLDQAGYKVVLDAWDWRPGQNFVEGMKKGVSDSERTLAVLSTNYFSSTFTTPEWQSIFAEDPTGEQGKLIPVRVDRCKIETLLKPLIYIDLVGKDERSAQRALLEGVKPTGRPTTKPAFPPDKPAFPAVEIAPTIEEAVAGSANRDKYLSRDTDILLQRALARRDGIIIVKGARQTGKTQLVERILHQASSRCIHSRLQIFEPDDLISQEALYRRLMREAAEALSLPVAPYLVWDADLNANENMDDFIRRDVIGDGAAPVIWVLDEVDRLRDTPYYEWVFGHLRTWFNRRATDLSGVWGHLTLVLICISETHLLMNDINQSPFNVGTRISVEDFSREQVDTLNALYGEPLRTQHERDAFYELVGGHPYLASRGLTEMTRGIPLSVFRAKADKDLGPFGEHLRSMLRSLRQNDALLETVRALLAGVTPGEDAFYHLRSAGILRGEDRHEARFRCQVYADFLAHCLR
jgi:hypothetical protein